MSNLKDNPLFIRQQSSENNSVSSSDWDMANDVSSCYEDPMGDIIVQGSEPMMMPGGGIDSRHLPLLVGDPRFAHQDPDGMILGLGEEAYYHHHHHHHHHLHHSHHLLHHHHHHHDHDATDDPGGGGTSYLDVPLDPDDYTESDGNVSSSKNLTKKRNRSTGSRHRGEVVTELGPEELRWFYKEDKRTWKPFIGHDSLKIEMVYLRFCEQYPERVKRRGPTPLRLPSEEGDDTFGSGGELQAESVTVAAVPAAEVVAGRGHRGSSVSSDWEPDAGSINNVEAVCVRGGLYEVDIKEKECYPVYWNQQDRIPVMRGQWFIDGTWLPLEEDESDLIEIEHLAHFRGQQMRDTYETEVVPANVDRMDAILSLKLSRSHVDWHSVDEVYLYSDATTSKIARTVSQKLGFSKASSSRTRLHRGYVEEAAPEDTPPETTHIVFVVHGIGQKMDQGRIIRNTSMMRDAARKMEEKHFADRTTEHVEFLPVEWRSKLALDGDTVDSITPDKVRGLRDMLNSSAMDIMYYSSPLYRDEITRGLTQELNRLYTLFCKRNPEFEENGKVSIVSHSLGCVITFDIMTGWDPVRFHHLDVPTPDESEARWPSSEERYVQEELRQTRLRLRDLEEQFEGLHSPSCATGPALKFKVENFFCMGSPLAVFLALRGVRPGNNGAQDHILPKAICQRLFNIFHPTDPVAYRLEPLILKHYSNISPVQIHWYNTTDRTLYDQIRPTLLNPLKESQSAPQVDIDNLPSPPCTSPLQARRHYGESIASYGKASIMGAASIGKGIGGMFFSRFSRSTSGHVAEVEEESLDSEGGASEVETVGDGEEGGVMEGGEERERQNEEETEREREVEVEEPFMSASASSILDHATVELERRVDFELREGMVESRYWSAVTSHTAYWCSHDVALFLLTFMYRQHETPPEQMEDHPESS